MLNIFGLIGLILIFFMFLFFIEIFEFNLFEISKNTKKNIEIRSDSDTDITFVKELELTENENDLNL